jgi:hypothetical protein
MRFPPTDCFVEQYKYAQSTLNIEDALLHALRLKAVDIKQSMSELVNDALKASLQEDLKDLKSWEERKGEDTYDYEELLKKDGVI